VFQEPGTFPRWGKETHGLHWRDHPCSNPRAMPTLDVPTLVFSAVVMLVCLVAVMAYHQRTGPAHPGFREWLESTVSIVLGMVLLGARSHIPVLLSSALGSGLMLFGVDRIYRGLQRFAGRPVVLSLDEKLVYLIGALAFGYLLFVDFRTPERVLVFSLIAAWTCVKCSVFCWRALAEPYRSSGRLLATLFLVSVGLNVVRGGLAVAGGDLRVELFQRGGLEAVALMGLVAVEASVVAALIILTGQRMHQEVAQAKAQVRELEGLIAICMYCKKIRDEEAWLQLERYFTERSNARFSHSMCPDCARKHHPDLEV